jgi:hypothetical protein
MISARDYMSHARKKPPAVRTAPAKRSANGTRAPSPARSFSSIRELIASIEAYLARRDLDPKQ